MAPRSNTRRNKKNTQTTRSGTTTASSANLPPVQAHAAASSSAAPNPAADLPADPPIASVEDVPSGNEPADTVALPALPDPPAPFAPPDLPAPPALPAVTPRVAKVSSFNFNHKKKGYYTWLVNEEMQKAYAQVGVEDFFRLCMSDPSARSLKEVLLSSAFEGLDKNLNFDDVPTKGEEALMYAPLCETIHALLQTLYASDENKKEFPCRLSIKETANVKEKKAPEVDIMPDLSLFDSKIQDAVASFENDTKVTKKSTATAKAQGGARESFTGRTSWAWTTSFIEAKNAPQWEPFDLEQDAGDFSKGVPMVRRDAEVHVTAPSLKAEALGRRSRSQVIKYVSEIQLRQHRNFVLCAHICQEWVRFMRWDRTGAILSKAVNYKKFPLVLLEFICRLATANNEGQGYDTSAQLVLQPRRTLNAFLKQKEGQWEIPYIQDMVADTKGFPIYEITCPGIDAPGLNAPLTLWVGRYWSGSRSPTGRGSKAYVAFDVKNERLVFLKDYWCAQHPTIHQELQTYERFRTAPMQPRYVAHCLGGGTVCIGGKKQVTLTQRLLAMVWLSSPALLERAHCRLVLQEIGRPLETFEHSSQLVVVLYKAFMAHEQAWQLAGVLHRDISPDNILIALNGDALLVDWDLCKYKEDLGQPASQHGRSGTWPFMSLALLQFPRKPNELADDLESFVYVLCFMALRFLKHDLSGPKEFDPSNLTLAQFLKSFFFEAQIRNTVWIGGQFKSNHVMARRLPGFTLDNRGSQVAYVINNFWALLVTHYHALDWVKMEREWSSTPPSSPVMLATGDAPTYELASLDIEDPLISAEDPQPPVGQASSSAGASSEASVPALPLSNHHEMKKVFRDALRRHPSTHDKIPDQFVDLPDPDPLSGAKLISQDTMASSSREVSRSSFSLELA